MEIVRYEQIDREHSAFDTVDTRKEQTSSKSIGYKGQYLVDAIILIQHRCTFVPVSIFSR
jgi:hypothetical protein